MKCIIIDDNEMAIKTLKSLLLNFCPDVEVLGSSQSIDEGVKLINEIKPDLLFLDVEIKNEIGFDLLSFFPNPSFSIIMTTAHEKYALNAIKNHCDGYLLKPIEPLELVKTVSDLTSKTNQRSTVEEGDRKIAKRLALVVNGEYLFLDESEILYLKADGKYTDITCTEERIFKSTKNLGEIENLLSESFFKCHKGYIINLDFVDKFKKNEYRIIMSDGSEIDLASRRKDEFLKLFERL